MPDTGGAGLRKAGSTKAAADAKAGTRRALDLRSDKLNALLDAAAIELNAYGVAGASLSRIARAVGVTRAALYYYFASREDLAFQSYARACRTMAADLAAAAEGKTGLARVTAFIERTLDPARPAAVVPSEVACLEPRQREEIEQALGANLAALTRFITDGQHDGSVRECDAEIAAHAILGMLFWAPLGEEWAAGSGEALRRNAARSVRDLVTDGVAADPDYPFQCAIDVESLAFRPGNAFDRGAAAAMKIELLTRAASKLFNRRGIDGTSLDQVTQELGATKGAFYQYLPDKAALIAECHRRQLDLSARIVEVAGATGRNGLERALTGMHLLVQAFAGDVAPLSPLTGVEALPLRVRNTIRKRGRELAQRYEQYNKEGIADGSYRPFEVRTLAIVGAGVFSWIPRWRADDDPRSPRFIADETVGLFIRGLRRRA